MNILIIQARMGSTRLPGKVLKVIYKKSVLETLIERILPAKNVDEIVIATTTNIEDNYIEDICKEKKWNYFRGSDWDVLDRYYQAAKTIKGVSNIIRLTSDCPLHSFKVVDFVVDQFNSSGNDYFSNSNNEPDYLEDGFDVEVFTFRALEKAWKEAKLLSEREHVTPFIKNSGYFKCGWGRYNSSYNYKLSVDSIDDFKMVSTIFKELGEISNFGMEEVVELLKNKPHLLNINKDSIINSGYLKSLSNDKFID